MNTASRHYLSDKESNMNDFLKFHSTDSITPVKCLGIEFGSENERREYYLNLLSLKLREPEFRKMEGFPKATDEAILAMSDPPYYTACPNPFLTDFIKCHGVPYDDSVKYSREPMAVDVSVGKSDPVYKAHSYHTKVPHLAIVPSILHYTEPGDIVLDGFGGSGMTAVAGQWCAVASPAYKLAIETEWRKLGRPAPKWGVRRVVLNELSPAATSIAAGYNFPFDVANFEDRARAILSAAHQELDWMYETQHTDGHSRGHINFTVWSEVFTCKNCAGEVEFYSAAFDPSTKKVRDELTCPHCGALATKEHMDLSFESFRDLPHDRTDTRPKRVPVLINYSIGKQSFEKKPDLSDLKTLRAIVDLGLPAGFPTSQLPDCQMTRVGRMRTTNTTCVHHMYLPRAAQVLSFLWERANQEPDSRLRSLFRFWLDSHFVNMSILNRYRPEVSFPYNPLTGVFYVPSLISEADPFTAYENKVKRLSAAFKTEHAVTGSCFISTGTAAAIPLPDSSIDFVFTDPPFGENIYYADLNFLIESWHKVYTQVDSEAIIDRVRGKGLHEYQGLMQRSFSEYFRVLKPGRWMTVVFSNSRASVWNAIQLSLQQAGFVVAEVTALDKQQGSFKQVTSTTAVKQDLIISAYKPNGGLEDRFHQNGATTDSAWDFVQTHLRQLPVVKVTSSFPQEMLSIVERDPRRIYDRMASWFIRHGTLVPLSTPEFLVGVAERYKTIDGMVLLPDQVAEYEKMRARMPEIKQAELFIADERSAIDWLSSFLQKRPSTRSEVHPEYIPQIGAAKKKGEIIPELDRLLEDNFLQYDGNGDVPNQISNWLSKNFHEFRGLNKDDPRLMAKAKDRWYVPDPNKAHDLEKRRDKALLKEFERYVASTARKLKEFRLEVLRGGFRAAWAAKDYATIIKVANKLPEEALQEDEKLLTLYDMALTRTEAGG